MKLFLYFLIALTIIGSCHDRSEKLSSQGNDIVRLIDEYRISNGNLPSSLEELGKDQTLNGPVFYEKRDSVNYILGSEKS